MAKLYIKKVSTDPHGIVPGAGFKIFEAGEPCDWPMLTTRKEAEQDLRDLIKADREVREEAASERRGLRMMGGW